MSGTSSVGRLAAPKVHAEGHDGGKQSDFESLTVVGVKGVAVLAEFASEIDRLNLTSVRPNPFLSAAFLMCYALRAEYFEPGRDERLFLIR